MLNSRWNQKKIICFDLDGTLTDPGIGITNSVMYALKKYDIEVSDPSELYKFIGPPLSESFERFYGFSKEESVRAVDTYREYFSVKGLFENEVYSGIEVLLKALREQDKIICLATSKPEVFAKRILEHFHLDSYFDFVVGSMMNGDRTNKAEVIAWVFHCLDQEGVEWNKEQVVMIGDREHDIIGAHKNNIPAIGVLFGYGDAAEMDAAGADDVAESVDDLYFALTGNKLEEV